MDGKKTTGKPGIGTYIIAFVLLVVLLGSCGNLFGGSGGRSAKTNTCKSCGRTFEAGDSDGNFMNIARTGMCNNCYENYQWGQKAIGND